MQKGKVAVPIFINHLTRALKEVGFFEDKGGLSFPVFYGLTEKFLKSDDPVKIKRMVGALRFISPEFHDKVPPMTDSITDEVREGVMDFLLINKWACPPIFEPLMEINFFLSAIAV